MVQLKDVMRLFTAIPLPLDVKNSVGEIIRGKLPVPYINRTNLHITLNFFGELSDAEVDKVKKVFEQSAKNLEKFKVEFNKLEKFRDQIHLSVKPSPELSAIRSLLQKQFEAVG